MRVLSERRMSHTRRLARRSGDSDRGTAGSRTFSAADLAYNSQALSFQFEGRCGRHALGEQPRSAFPATLVRQVLKAIRTRDAVTLYGVRPRAAEMTSCVPIASVRGRRIDDPKYTGQEAKASCEEE